MISNLLVSLALAAHPLGNFSVNSLVELTLRPDRVDAVAVVDLAELPTLQMTPSCDDFASALSMRVNGLPLRWTIQSRQAEQPDGAAGLKTTRLTCTFTAPAGLDSPTSINIDNAYLADRVGWHEITARGDRVNLRTGLPSRSATDGLRHYPTDPLSSPMQVRRASFTTSPGADAARSAAPTVADDRSLLKRAEGWLTNTIGDPTPLVGLLAVLLSVLLGAAHAALPGHGKTVIAVYLAGRKGRRRDALYVGATVTLTHTAGVLILGIGLTAVASLAAESVLAWLGIVSGAIMFFVGVGMLFSAFRRRRARALAAAHAEASAARWLEVARWHDVDRGVGIIHSLNKVHRDIHIDSNANRLVNVDSRVNADSRVEVIDRDYMHSSEHGHAHDPDDESIGDVAGRKHDHGYGHHHHGHHHHHHHGHGHRHEHGHSHGDEHDREHDKEQETQSGKGFWRGLLHGHGNGHGPGHSHGHGHEHGQGRASLTLLGVAGGLVPSPTALVVLLGAVALGRTWFGITLIAAYGLGMAGTLTAAGLLLIRLRDRWSWLNRLSIPPSATGSLVIALGLGLAARAALTI